MVQLGYGYTRVEGIKSFYPHFNMLWKKIHVIREEHDAILDDLEYKTVIENDISAREHIRSISVLDEKHEQILTCPIFYKISKSKNELVLIKNYNSSYLYNTLIKELLCAGEKGHKQFAKWLTYCLYYYRLFRSDTFETVCSIVLDDIADIIGIIVRKEFSTYKEFNTGSALDQLRIVYRNEKMVQLGLAPTNLNLRRRR